MNGIIKNNSLKRRKQQQLASWYMLESVSKTCHAVSFWGRVCSQKNVNQTNGKGLFFNETCCLFKCVWRIQQKSAKSHISVCLKQKTQTNRRQLNFVFIRLVHYFLLLHSLIFSFFAFFLLV